MTKFLSWLRAYWHWTTAGEGSRWRPIIGFGVPIFVLLVIFGITSGGGDDEGTATRPSETPPSSAANTELTPSGGLAVEPTAPTLQPTPTEQVSAPTVVEAPTLQPTPTEQVSAPTVVEPPTPPTPVASTRLVVTVAIPALGRPTYDRDDWRHWVDADGDCQDARQEVLTEEGLSPVVFRTSQSCQVASGQWYGSFTGTTVTDPSELDVDHMVPLANAHESGAWAWTSLRKMEYANYLTYDGHLIAVTASANRSKGARGPEEWRPPNQAYWCQYATDWTTIKNEWDLTATSAEATALQEMLSTCTEPVTLIVEQGEVGVTPTADPPIVQGEVDATPTPMPQEGPTAQDALALYDDNGNGRITCAEARNHGIAPVYRGHPAYQYMNDLDNDGVVCE